MTESRFLIFRDVVKKFDDSKAVDGVSFDVAQGQMVAIIGRSGAGKSTLLNLTNRLIDPTSGSIICSGLEITKFTGSELLKWRRSCAMIFQRFNLVHRLDVLTNVLIGRLNHAPHWPKLFNVFSDEDRNKAIDALHAVGMLEFALKRADQLSGGQQQRVAIARAMVQEPRIILADEPVASLDPVNVETVMDALRQINQPSGITVLCNLHSVPLARKYCDRIIGLSVGKVVFDGLPSALNDEQLLLIYGSRTEFEGLN